MHWGFGALERLHSYSSYHRPKEAAAAAAAAAAVAACVGVAFFSGETTHALPSAKRGGPQRLDSRLWFEFVICITSKVRSIDRRSIVLLLLLPLLPLVVVLVVVVLLLLLLLPLLVLWCG